MKTMRAVVLEGITSAEQIALTERPVPQARPGWVLVKVEAFGMNHSEQILRQSEIEAAYIQKPVIPGIECVGTVADASDSDLRVGARVAALMGGMGRSFDGSYAEYALLPARNVFAVDSDLPWTALGAMPETYYTAWGSLMNCLRLEPEDTLLVRGATCALGYAAVQLAKAMGCRVVATTHRAEKLPLLNEADEALLDEGELAGRVKGANKALELVGPRTLLDTLRAMPSGGVVCNTGVLGGAFALRAFQPIQQIPTGVYLTSFHSNWPTRRDMDALFAYMKAHDLAPKLGRAFDFAENRKAVRAQDEGSVNGKIVVRVSSPA